MPNWVENQIIIKGTEEQILTLLNEILENSNEEKCDTFGAAYEKVQTSAKHKIPNEEKTATVLGKGLRFSSVFPIPDTFLLNDTTNEPDQFPDAVKEQSEGWGIIGWYDYNLRFFGCKWDCEMSMSIMEIPIDSNECALSVECDTPWASPIAFLERIMEKFGVKVYITAIDVGQNCAFSGEVGGEIHDVTDEYFK